MQSSATAEKSGEGMALKILTRAEDIPDGRDPFGKKNPVESGEAVAYNTIAFR